jgi:hypothetical protein
VAEVEVGGVKLSGGKGMAIMMGIGSLIGTLYGGFEVYKDYMDMKAKLANLEPEAIQQQIDVAMVKLDEGVSYAKDIKTDLRSDVIAVEKALGDVERRIRETEAENRNMVKEAQRWFDERTALVDQNQKSMEERLNKRITQALTNALEGDQ